MVWYTGQFYALFFLQITLKVDYLLAYQLIGLSLLIGTPFFIFFGWLSDRIGRLKIILAGCAARRAHLLPDLQGADAQREPGAGAVSGQHADQRRRRRLQLSHLRFPGDELHGVRSRQGLPDQVRPVVRVGAWRCRASRS